MNRGDDSPHNSGGLSSRLILSILSSYVSAKNNKGRGIGGKIGGYGV